MGQDLWEILWGICEPASGPTRQPNSSAMQETLIISGGKLLIGRRWRIVSGAKPKDEVVVGVTQRLANDQQLRVVIPSPAGEHFRSAVKQGQIQGGEWPSGDRGVLALFSFKLASLAILFAYRCLPTPGKVFAVERHGGHPQIMKENCID